MHLLVIGGTGRTGKLVVGEALQQDHTVTALVQDESKLETNSPQVGLTVVKGMLKNKRR